MNCILTFARKHDGGSHTKVTICEMIARFTPNHGHSKCNLFTSTYEPVGKSTVTSSEENCCSPCPDHQLCNQSKNYKQF